MKLWRLPALLLLCLLALQASFALRIAAMAWIDPQSTSFQRSEAWRLLSEQGRIDWAKSAPVVHDQVRGLHPWPGAWTTLGVRRLLVHRTTREGAPTR